MRKSIVQLGPKCLWWNLPIIISPPLPKTCMQIKLVKNGCQGKFGKETGNQPFQQPPTPCLSSLSRRVADWWCAKCMPVLKLSASKLVPFE